jgi:carboxypeptidase C (cathepsin A)
MQDNPVGTGYSFVEDDKLYVKTDEEAGNDLTTLLEKVFNKDESLQKSPLFIVAESYGGKYAVTLGLSALRAIEAGKLKLKLGGNLFSSNISPFSDNKNLKRRKEERKKKKQTKRHGSLSCAQSVSNSAIFMFLPCVGVVLGDSWISPEDFVVHSS